MRGYGEEIVESLRKLGSLFRRAVDAYRSRRAINQTIRELSRLEDHLLGDIGLNRSQIESVAYSIMDHGRIVR
jgi:uncharacterized protein YjiS (DUF1127 family)